MHKIMKKKFLLVCTLFVLLLICLFNLPNVNAYANSNNYVKQDIIYNTDTFIDYEAEKAFIEGINNRSNAIFIPTMNDDNKWDLFYMLLYKYLPDTFMHSWMYENNESGKRIVNLGYANHYNKKDSSLIDHVDYYILINDKVYERLNDMYYYSEYDKFINDIIKKSNVNKDMDQDQMVLGIVNYISSAYYYDYDVYVKHNIPKWKIPRDYGISVCDSDSKLAKACFDKLDIECRIVKTASHAWNQILRNGRWEAIDITHYREYGNYYLYFDDSYRDIEQIFR